MYQDRNLETSAELFNDISQFFVDVDAVFRWGQARNITAEGGATALSQIKKLKEEVQEIEDALLSGDKRGAKDGVGDTLVVLLQVCRLAGLDLGECLHLAYEEIKDRKGKMIDGVFVKEEDLNE